MLGSSTHFYGCDLEKEEATSEDSVHRAPSVPSVQKAVNFDGSLPSLEPVGSGPVYRVAYSDELAARVCDLYIAGNSLRKISKLEGMPSYAALLRWAKERKEFREQLVASRAVRALHFEDTALAAADEVLDMDDKDRAAVARLRFDAFKWGAEVNDPAQYGKKTTISGDASKPIVFQIVTGVPAPEEKEVLLDKTGIVQDVVETTGEVISEDTAIEPAEG